MLSVLTIGVTVGMVAGCGGSKPGEITVLINRTDLKNTVLKDAKSQFEEKYKDKGWTVNFETISDYEGDTTIRMSGRAYGDVLLIPDFVLTTELEYYFMPLGNVYLCLAFGTVDEICDFIVKHNELWKKRLYCI